MTTVILAEKPSQALAYAQAFQSFNKENGFFKIKDPIFEEETFITFGFGHLVELAAPGDYKEDWEKWSLNNLPVFPENFKFVVAEDKKKQFRIVSELLQSASTIIIATDSDREGENIAWAIIHKAKAYSSSKRYKRLWINSLEKESIREGFKNLKPAEDYYPFYVEAQTRQISDWLIGMNGSPLYSLYLQNKGVNENFSLGRVQTPTLYMIYRRQCEVEEFVKSPYFELSATFKTKEGELFQGVLTPNKKFAIKEDLLDFIDNSGISEVGETEVKEVETKEKKTHSPSLFSLSSLQTESNQKFKASADDTLKAVQTLYEKKLLSYPRTDSNFITHNEFDYLKANLERYKSFLEYEGELAHLEARKHYVDNQKVQEHHAIILTKQVPNEKEFRELTDLQQKIYLLIAKTTLAMFLADYCFSETVISVNINNLNFTAKGTTPLKRGWKELFNISEEKGNILPHVKKEEALTYQSKILEKETTPPKPYTEGTLISAMKSAGKTVDDNKSQKILKEVEGIGTEATRAGIIETLKNKKYIIVNKNYIRVTNKGILLCKAVEKQPLLTSAEMTAKWEGYLRKIGKKEKGVSQEKFLDSIKKFIIHLLENVPKDIESLDFNSYQSAQNQSAKLLCPDCSEGVIMARKGFYGCSSYPNCKFTIADNFRGKKLSQKNIEELIKVNQTIVKKIKKKDSKITYNVSIKRNEKGFFEIIDFVK